MAKKDIGQSDLERSIVDLETMLARYESTPDFAHRLSGDLRELDRTYLKEHYDLKNSSGKKQRPQPKGKSGAPKTPPSEPSMPEGKKIL